MTRTEVLREERLDVERYETRRVALPPIALVVHGRAGADAARAIAACGVPLERILWTCEEDAPAALAHATVDRRRAASVARAATERRGDRAVAFLDAAVPVPDGWLADLADALYAHADANAAAFVAPPCISPLDACDARAALVSLRDVPQHERLRDDLALDASLRDFTARLRGYARATVGVPHPCGMRDAQAPARDAGDVREATTYGSDDETPLVSIVTLSWNAPDYTKTALESIRRFTNVSYEVIVVDNGSGSATTDWLRTVDDVRVVWNATNLGFARGCNQGIAAARGRYVLLLNNDVVVTDGWLDDLLDAHRRNPGIGVTAPRSNRIAGSQIVLDAEYTDIDGMHRVAAQRRARYRRSGYFTERAIGFCLCIDRRVIDEVGGIDERYGIGNFEDDDFCVRVRAAGYLIYVCDDVFIHHFGSISFQTNNVDYRATMHENWRTFARKWDLPEAYPTNGYQPQPIVARGFDRERHFFALPAPSQAVAPPEELVRDVEAAAVHDDVPRRGSTFVAVVRDEADWNEVAAVVRRFARTFADDDDARFAIAAVGTLDARTLAARAEKIVVKEGRTVESVGDLALDDVADAAAWLATLEPTACMRVQANVPAPFADVRLLEETSPSALKRAALQPVSA